MLRTDSTCSALWRHAVVALTRRAARRENAVVPPAVSSALHRPLRPQREQACTGQSSFISRCEIAISAISDYLERNVGHGLDAACVS